jgi:Protein of unknown function (DUF2442)
MANKQWTNLISEEALDAQIAKAQQAGETAELMEPRARAIAYDTQQDAIVIYLKTDVFIGIPRKFLQGLENATAEDLQDFWLTSNGDAVHWEKLNASFSIPGLVTGTFGTRQWMAELLTLQTAAIV